ncbi:katanin p80 WD40 repeat-containing subunit B1 homolog KTN80.2-like isoform X2 [Diospyros lotus]|uniref:katanin p80 WD40 repeat-containing subunit B1 homolog KTN80.2-like isoform X2 n=1 Tax=Diospyros lotus TaxID=55363 RepID=UPI002256BBC3|nr:katanin p80 WD40 repeat-containing subunit B1 homolog KTN80.2-like isoform X2 [Diospyros lotus]
MAKHGYKLQEFVAHSGGLNCVHIGKKTCRLLITGGDDQKVNLWSFGKPDSLMSLCGHTSPVESVTFDTAEVLVLAGASSGAIKLWDLEETKIVRTLTGHRSYCTAVQFHPFGEFLASGAMDTNLKIWDIRKKGCVHTYKGHTRGVSTIKFSPDGRWVVTGGLDNVVKVWDLTAGKLLHDFKFHEGHIRSIDFHPLEFLMATGSADRTVKFWDLETFELIGSTGPEATGVRSITFHPDGKTLFCGLDDNIKVYSWEPTVCHDTVNMRWSTLGDLCIHEGKLLGCSYYQNSAAVWAAEISFVEPYAAGSVPELDTCSEQKFDRQESPMATVRSQGRTASSAHCRSLDYDTKEIKNIYIDSGNPVASKKVGSHTSPKIVFPSDSKEISHLPIQKQVPAIGMHERIIMPVNTKSVIASSIIPRDSPDGKVLSNFRRESITSERTSPGRSLKPAHIRSLSATQFNAKMLSVPIEMESITKTIDETAVNPRFHDKLVGDDAKETSGGKYMNIKTVAQKFEKTLSAETPPDQESCNKSLKGTEENNSVKLVNGVVLGRTRSLVERFERRERFSEVRTPDTTPDVTPKIAKTAPLPNRHKKIGGRELTSLSDGKLAEGLMQSHDVFLSTLHSRLTKLQVLRHFWERNDIKGAIDAMRKLPDHSVQADLVGVLMEKMEILSLDLFSRLLPVLLSLLDSKIERHANISLELLLKLVAVFGPVVRSTVSVHPAIGVDLQAEQRLECCKQCFIQLQKIQKILPALIRRGGLVAKCAQELNLILRDSIS